MQVSLTQAAVQHHSAIREGTVNKQKKTPLIIPDRKADAESIRVLEVFATSAALGSLPDLRAKEAKRDERAQLLARLGTLAASAGRGDENADCFDLSA